MNPKEYFEKNRYVYLSDVLSKEDCAKITEHMWNLKEQGKLIQDEQCPKSWAVYGDPILDDILGRLAKPLGAQLGLELIPTYTYARIYQPGEILKRHTDRESCEISGTLTLGHDPESEIWPIFFTDDPEDTAGQCVTINIGDMVMYHGNELTHWRPAYRGRWQTQVFFHYVDANGPHKEWAFDKRENLGTPPQQKEKRKWQDTIDKTQQIKETPQQRVLNARSIYNGVILDDGDDISPGWTSFNESFHPEMAFTKEQCDKIISIAQTKYPAKARVGTGDDGRYDNNIRRVDQYTIPVKEDTRWIFDKVLSAVNLANREYYNFELAGITHELQLLHYKSDEQGFYDWHTDTGNGPACKRKLSIVAMLSDPSEYEGGQLKVNNHGQIVDGINTKGAINMFPSYMLHTVTPVTKGERWVLVIWVHGSQRFK